MKEVYPYSYFQSVEEMKNTSSFPPLSGFRTDLKGDCDPELYKKAKSEFDRRISLDSNDSEKWTSFVDYLKYYNGLIFTISTLCLMMKFRKRCFAGLKSPDFTIFNATGKFQHQPNAHVWPPGFQSSRHVQEGLNLNRITFNPSFFI